MNLKRQGKPWTRGSVKMDTITDFALEIQSDDQLMSLDEKNGYRNFYLHPSMREMFIFRYEGRYDR